MDIVGDLEGSVWKEKENVLYSPPHHEGRIHVILQTRRKAVTRLYTELTAPGCCITRIMDGP
jgi:hypothetical protein